MGKPLGLARVIDTIETSDARAAAPLFRKSFGHPVPPMPRHYVMLYRPPQRGTRSAQPLVIGYAHQLAFENVSISRVACASTRRRTGCFALAVRRGEKREGGFATIIMKDSFATLGDCPAAFGTSATGARAWLTFAPGSSTRAGRI